ncbi:hypothetical protein ABEX47_07600 [Paenibacillus ehimensis]|uniref:hypothetical protein n=1 Tax=Paenibacillus ehimensis TaxID=79264 RepID=UPI003D2B5CFF
MRTTKRIQAGAAPDMPGHLRFAEQITRKYGFASRNYLGPQRLNLLEPGEGDSPAPHVSLVQFTLHLRLQLQLLKQEERDMLRSYRRTLHLLEKLARRHDASERKASTFSPAGRGAVSRIAAATSAAGTARADRKEGMALRSNVGGTKRAFASRPKPVEVQRHARVNGKAAGVRSFADAGTMRPVPAEPMVHPARRFHGRGTKETLALRKDYRLAERSGKRHVSGEQVQARRKPESKAMAVLRRRNTAAKVRDLRDERKRGLQQGPLPGEGRRSPLSERESYKPGQEKAFGQVLEWKRVALRQQPFPVMADDVLVQNVSRDRAVRSRLRSDNASSPFAADDKRRIVSDSRGGGTYVRAITAASPLDADDKRHRTLEGDGGRSTGWKDPGKAIVAGLPWLRPKGMSSSGIEALLRHRIGLFEAGSLYGDRTSDAWFDNGRAKGRRQTDAAPALEGRSSVLGPLRMIDSAKLLATSSMRNISDHDETVILSTAFLRRDLHDGVLMNRPWPGDFWSTATVLERGLRQKANAGLIYGWAPFPVQRKAGDQAALSILLPPPSSVSLPRDAEFVTRCPGRSSNKFGGSGFVPMLAGAVPSNGISAVGYADSARSAGSVPLRSQVPSSSGWLYHSRIAEAESAEMRAGSIVPARQEGAGLAAALPKRAAAKTGMPTINVSGANLISPIGLAIRLPIVEGLQLRPHSLPFGGGAAAIGPQIYAAGSIEAVRQRSVRRHQGSRSAPAPTSGKHDRHDAKDAVPGFAGEAVRGFTGGTVSGSANPVIRSSFTDGAGSVLAGTVHRSTPSVIRESVSRDWNSADVRRHAGVPAGHKKSRFLSVHSSMRYKSVSLGLEGRFSTFFPGVTDFAAVIAGKRGSLKHRAEKRTMRRHPAGSMLAMAPVAQFRAILSQHAEPGQAAIVFGPAVVQAMPGTSPRASASRASKLPQVRADWPFATLAGVPDASSPLTLHRPLQLNRSAAVAPRPSAVFATAPGVLLPGAPPRPLGLHPAQADAQRPPAIPASISSDFSPRKALLSLQFNQPQTFADRPSTVPANASGVLPSRRLHRPLQLNRSQVGTRGPSAMPANVPGVLSPRSKSSWLELHRSQTVASWLFALPARVSGVLSPRTASSLSEPNRSPAALQRLSATPASALAAQPPQTPIAPLPLHPAQRPPAVAAHAPGALTLRVPLQARTAQQPAKAAAVTSPSYRAARSEIEYHKKQKPDTRTVAKQAAAQAVSQVSAQLEAMQIELSTASQAALPDLDRFVDQVYRELENKIKFERQRSGL